MESLDRDPDTKQMLQEISSTFGVKQDIIKQVWEFTLFTMMLNVANKPDGFEKLSIPYVGNLILKNNGYKADAEGKISVDIDSYISLSDSFKKLYEDVSKNTFTTLSEYLEKNYIENVANNIV